MAEFHGCLPPGGGARRQLSQLSRRYLLGIEYRKRAETLRREAAIRIAWIDSLGRSSHGQS
jgi:hypothetical protein